MIFNILCHVYAWPNSRWFHLLIFRLYSMLSHSVVLLSSLFYLWGSSVVFRGVHHGTPGLLQPCCWLKTWCTQAQQVRLRAQSRGPTQKHPVYHIILTPLGNPCAPTANVLPAPAPHIKGSLLSSITTGYTPGKGPFPENPEETRSRSYPHYDLKRLVLPFHRFLPTEAIWQWPSPWQTQPPLAQLAISRNLFSRDTWLCWVALT